MPTPSQIIPVMEGLVGTAATSTAGKQAVATWVEMCKVLLRDPDVRDVTDLQFVIVDDLANAADVVDTGATHLLALLIDQDAADAERDWVAVLDADSGTFLGDSILGNNNVVLIQPPVAATDNTSEYWGVVFAQPLSLETGLSIGADGRDGTAPAANDLRVFCLYRN